MIFKYYRLSGRSLKDLNTEIRYNVATARADGVELLRFELSRDDDERNMEKNLYCIARILSSMKRDGHIQFFVKSLSDNSREAEYIKNKYADNIPLCTSDIEIYLKL